MNKIKKKVKTRKSPYEKFAYSLDPRTAQLAWTLIVGIAVAFVAFEHASFTRPPLLDSHLEDSPSTYTKEAFEPSQSMR